MFAYAKYLSEHTDLHVYYVDYHDGYSHDLYTPGTPIQFIDYDPNADTLPLREPVIVVVNSTRVVQIKKLPPQSKLLLWHWETVPCAWEAVLINDEARRLLKLAYENSALVYHDWSSRSVFKQQFGLDFQNRDYLQIRAESREYPSVRKPLHKGRITIAWLGRLSSDKRYSLYNIMSHLARLKDPRPRRLIVIGDGLYRKEAEACAEKYKDKFETVFLGTVAHEELAACLRSMADAEDVWQLAEELDKNAIAEIEKNGGKVSEASPELKAAMVEVAHRTWELYRDPNTPAMYVPNADEIFAKAESFR